MAEKGHRLTLLDQLKIEACSNIRRVENVLRDGLYTIGGDENLCLWFSLSLRQSVLQRSVNFERLLICFHGCQVQGSGVYIYKFSYTTVPTGSRVSILLA